MTARLADAVAPILALGLAVGRIGCYLNGCCWGQVAVEEVAPVPLGGAHFPLLPAHCRDQLVREAHVAVANGAVRLDLVSDSDARVARWAAGREGDLFERAFGRELEVG